MRRFIQTSITLEGWYVLLVVGFVSAGGIIREINLLLVVAGMLLAPLLYNAWVVGAALRRLKLSRKLPRAVSAGDRLVVDVVVENPCKRHRWAVAVTDQISRVGEEPDEPRIRASAFFDHLPPEHTTHVPYEGRIEQRGRYRLGPMTVVSRFPLGLVQRKVVVDTASELLVFPRAGQLTRRWQELHQQMAIEHRRARQRHAAMEGDFVGLRDWRSGDGRKLIHWPTSARYGNLMVRQFAQQRRDDLMLLIDLWAPEGPSAQQRQRVETAVSFAASVAQAQCRQGGSRLYLGIAGAEPEFFRGVASHALLRELMEVLADVRAGDSDLKELLARSRAEAPRHVTTVIASTRRVSGDFLTEGIADSGNIAIDARRAVVLEVGTPEFHEYFQLEYLSAASARKGAA